MSWILKKCDMEVDGYIAQQAGHRERIDIGSGFG